MKPVSVHGMLWLQTHFEDDQWVPISEGRVIISEGDAKLLMADANLAGITIDIVSDISVLDVSPKTN